MISIIKKNKDLYVISHLNNNSILLAKSIRNAKPDALIYFADNSASNKTYEQSAKSFGCKILRKRITELDLSWHNKNIPVVFVLISENEKENLDNALRITMLYRDKINAEIYTLNSSKESECIFDSIYKGNGNSAVPPVKLRRVNAIRNQIYYHLLNYPIFQDAIEIYNEKIISVLIVGMGSYGLEMLKALIWCGQMDGYVLRFNIIDRAPDIETRFYKECPGIRQRGFQPKSGEDYYEIYFHSGIDVNTENFTRTVYSLNETTYAFVSLGDEQLNIETAIDLRAIFSGAMIDMGKKPNHSPDDKQIPHITAVIHSDDKSNLLKGNKLSNSKGQCYQIDCIGSNSEQYSFENIFYSKLEKMALAMHMQWGTKEEFDNYEYNRRSSMASAIHKKYRDALMPDDETKDILEHKRWNAYMRSTEGYSFGLVRDDIALRHPLLVKYDHLSRVEKDKDKKANQTNLSIF